MTSPTTLTEPTPTHYPFFPVSTGEFAAMSIATFGRYVLYWCCKNWQRIRDRENKLLSPFWRAFFAPVWGLGLFVRVRDYAQARGFAAGWSAFALAGLFFVLSLSWRLPDPWWLISLFAIVPVLPVVSTIVHRNELGISGAFPGPVTESARRQPTSPAPRGRVTARGTSLPPARPRC